VALAVGFAIVGLVYAPPPPGKGGGGGGDTPLCITFDNLPGDAIQSDDAGGAEVAYCDDPREKISAVIRADNGALAFSTNNTKKRVAGRTVFVDFSGCAGIDPCDAPNFPDVRFDDPPPPGDEPCCGYPDKAHIGTGRQYTGGPGAWVPGTALDLLAMEDGEEARVELGVNMVHSFDGDPSIWFLRFAPAICADTDPVTITRVDADTWEIVASESDVACLERGQAHIPKGHYNMPFGMTLKRAP
jgi:hypothetical protein